MPNISCELTWNRASYCVCKEYVVVAGGPVHSGTSKNSANEFRFNPLTPTVAIWVQLYSIQCQTRLSHHLQFLTSWHSDAQPWASECPDVKNYTWPLNLVWHRMLCSCTHMATVGVKGLSSSIICIQLGGEILLCLLTGWRRAWKHWRFVSRQLCLMFTTSTRTLCHWLRCHRRC